MRLTPSGMRGKVNRDLTIDVVLDFTKKFAKWLGSGSRVALGRDTRDTSLLFSNAVSSGLISIGIDVIELGIVPTPILLHYLYVNDCTGGIVITGSHNPAEYNGIKYVGPSHTFIDNYEIQQISNINYQEKNSHIYSKWDKIGRITQDDPLPSYISHLNHIINQKIISNRKLNVVVDTNAGAAKDIISEILSKYGCSVTSINEEFKDLNFPRRIEPIAENLSLLVNIVKKLKADVGFAYDCDADRVTVVGPDGKVYPEDFSVLLPLYHILIQNSLHSNPKDVLIVTNIASSLAIDEIANEFHGKVYRTPVGEQYLAKKFAQLQMENPNALVLGGEGSSGGFMYPEFNNARDGIFASCIICEFLSSHSKSLLELIEKIPRYYSYRESFTVPKTLETIKRLKIHLNEKKIMYISIGNDVKILNQENNEWILVHPSNTEPVVRVIAEAKESKIAYDLVKKYRAMLLKKT